MRSKGLKRLAFFVVFLIPVVWYLFLQLFGSNNFSLELQNPVPEGCLAYEQITIASKDDSLSVVETNYMNRVIYGADKRSANLIYNSQEYFDCLNQPEADLVLINKEGLWGAYNLNREGVDQLLTELDILTLQQSYGKGTSR
ncbi:hypothetical protein SAMN05421640_1234 [Ekhidna lutea]|uniref:Uncharacterized protein n=1 Tax=Ekhidna lutea TaxID=447679 RepID=A0A239HBV5_EKHLU|nr:hypothetical protein [Ekhidna lutea]SNS78645.1 hypothetical protein SAMN05421640_1234 [Ekhidna lutea]